MRTTIIFGEENIITPAEDGLDDLLKMVADVMTEEGVSGTFFVTGQRANLLRQRGRRDVLDAICRHDLGSHTGMASIHPTVAERIEHADWSDGVARMAADEFAAIEEVFGKPVRSFGRHGASYNPQLVAALARRSLPYVYSFARLPLRNITWFCNTLNFAHTATYFQEALSAGEPRGSVAARTVGPYLKEAPGIADEVRQTLAEWPTHRPDIDSSSICLLTMLQTWTLKPAWPGAVPAFCP